MGYCADLRIELFIPNKVDEKNLLEQLGEFSGELGSLEEAIATSLSAVGDLETYTEADYLMTTPSDTKLVVAGCTGDKLMSSAEDALNMLAEAGVTGTVDGHGEDADIWRWRLAGGKLYHVPGEIVYPGDRWD